MPQEENFKFGTIIQRLLKAEPGEAVEVKPPPALTLNRFADELMDCLLHHPEASQHRWNLNTNHHAGWLVAVQVPEVEGTSSDQSDPKEENMSSLAVVPTHTEVSRTVVSSVPKGAVIPSLFLSRAFEMVIAEMESSLDDLKDSDDNSIEMANCIKNEQDIIRSLRDYHPAVMGSSSTGACVSIYERALERAEAELRIINLELQRLTKRKAALEPMIAAMKSNTEAERDTR